MKVKYIVLAIGAVFSPGLLAATNNTPIDINQRFALMEQRLIYAEQRATDAEAQIKELKQQQTITAKNASAVKVESTEPIAPGAEPTKLTLSGYGDIKMYGDVEFNMDGASKSGSLTSVKNTASKNWAPGSNERWDINGRILLGFDGIRKMDNGNFAGFSAQPLADMTGKMNLDDAVFFFGRKDDWKVKVGRFEAYDMFPLNQDTFVEYSGNTANDLYSDGYGYIYMMKEGRGRSSSGGNFLVSKTQDNWYFELNSLVENGSTLFQDSNYHGNTLENKKNVAYLRPVIAWNSGRFSTAVAMEKNVVKNAYGYYANSGPWVDQSDRTGYGLTMSWNGQKTAPEDGVMTNLNVAYMDASDETNFTAGINSLWHRFELGYIYAHNQIDKFNSTNYAATCDDSCWISSVGDYDIHTLHASYLLPDIMNMKNFNIYLGTYASWIEADLSEGNKHKDARYGGRVRFKYFF
ncbi:carbohydrate porin [Yersinia intermedia]|uniref:carbohydrate porin n=1 Tax=Yersinia intermedia TaxID=631 RepID=UPI000B71E61E|nr:carbohydrate porin [Yersinia intermedia]MCW8111940.1 carbohydrate porin [Yersinia intermedia]MDA5483305.1 carbohydrate porin [Yersinia intermedia]MDA5518850.1 carbohydrate porin [Yersinia intermedia]OWF91908.1 porin [Yersinia intermedia]